MSKLLLSPILSFSFLVHKEKVETDKSYRFNLHIVHFFTLVFHFTIICMSDFKLFKNTVTIIEQLNFLKINVKNFLIINYIPHNCDRLHHIIHINLAYPIAHFSSTFYEIAEVVCIRSMIRHLLLFPARTQDNRIFYDRLPKLVLLSDIICELDILPIIAL